jgi:hypothetical protein
VVWRASDSLTCCAMAYGADVHIRGAIIGPVRIGMTQAPERTRIKNSDVSVMWRVQRRFYAN